VRINGIVGEEILVVVIDRETPDEVRGRRLVVAIMGAVDRYPGFEIDSEDQTMIAVEIKLYCFEGGLVVRKLVGILMVSLEHRRKAFSIALAGGFNYDTWSDRAGYVRTSGRNAFFQIARSLPRDVCDIISR
jgi:hypothetical protein